MADKTTVENLKIQLYELEEELRNSRGRVSGLQREINLLNVIYGNTNSPIFLKAADLTYLFINQQFELLSGSSDENIKGKNDYDVFPKPIADLFRDQDEQVIKRRERIEFEETVSLPVGELTFITSKFPVFDNDGEIIALGGICTNITSLKKTELSLRESEKKWRNMFDSCSMGILSYRLEPDGNLKFVESNQAASDILGVDCSKFVGKTIEEAFPPLADTEVPERYRQACLHGIPWHTEQITYQDDQIAGAYEVNAFQTDPGMMAAMFRDITHRKQAEEKLHLSEERFRTLVENIGLGVTLLNPGMKVQTANKQIRKWFPHADVENHPVCHHVFNDPPREECCNYCPVVKTLADGQVHEAVTDRPTREGVNNFRVLSTPVKDSDGSITHIIEVVEDITDRLKMEEERHRSKKIESIGILAGGIAHDFNNLLTSIMGNISLAKRFIDPDNKAYDRLSATEKAVHRAQDLTYQLLTFSQGGAPILKTISIEQMVKDSVSYVLSCTDINLDFSTVPDLWPVEIDEGQISQVIQNIVTNAIEVMPRGGNLTVTLENMKVIEQDGVPLRAGKYTKIKVQDQGPGIPLEDRDKVFDPFFTTKKSGSGLGLAISYSIMKKHKGLITFETGDGSGTSFHIYLPASDKPPQAETSRTDDIIHGRGRILVMDDNEEVLETATQMLSHLGYKVEITKDGMEAVNFYREAMGVGQAYDAVILDLTVPQGIGGRKAMQMIRDYDSDAKVIVSSGYSNDPVMKEYAQYGFSGVVQKPYKLGQLSRTVHEVLKGKTNCFPDQKIVIH